jgi:formamidopyrimidine-DNA glycosylase
VPELPEVETVRRSLTDHVAGRQVIEVEVRDPYVLRGQPVAEFQQGLLEQTLSRPERHGKLLFFPLPRRTLIVHLGMTGQLTIRLPERADTPFLRHETTGLERTLQHAPDKHTHISLRLDNGAALHYRDVRKFGRVYVIPETDRADVVARFGLGVDPLTDQYSQQYLASRLMTRKTPIKAALLDQAILAGLGNIYVDEALFLAGIRPGRAAYRVRGQSLRRLVEAIPQVLLKGIEAGGTTLRDFVSGTGQTGYNQEGLLAYGRHGQECLVCGQQLRRGVFAGRTTSWCAHCQK